MTWSRNDAHGHSSQDPSTADKVISPLSLFSFSLTLGAHAQRGYVVVLRERSWGGGGGGGGGGGERAKCKLRREIRIHKYTEVKKQLAK